MLIGVGNKDFFIKIDLNNGGKTFGIVKWYSKML